MTGPTPTPSAAPLAQDHLSGAVLRSLKRPLPEHLAWGPTRTFILGLLSFGLYPFLRWSGRLSDWMRLERQQLWHVAEWLRLHTGQQDATDLRDRTDAISLHRGFVVLGLICVAGVVGAGLAVLSDRSWSLGEVLDQTYWVPGTLRRPQDLLDWPLFLAWTGGLSAAYLLHWMRVQVHAAEMRQIVQRVNTVLNWEGIEPIAPPTLGLGTSLSWIIAAAAMVYLGAWWGVPLMLAGGAHRMYTTRTSERLRHVLADRMQLMLLAQRPRVTLAVPTFIGGACRNPRCRAPLPSEAEFCPRCGTRTRTILSEVA